MEEADDNLRMLLRSAVHGTAAMTLTTHMLIALIRKGVLQPDDATALVGEAMAFSRAPDDEPSEYADLVCETLGRIAGLLRTEDDGLH